MADRADRIWAEQPASGSSPVDIDAISRLLVFSYFSREEIERPAFGGSRLIAAQAEFFEERGVDISLIDLERLAGPTGLVLSLAGWVRRRRRTDSDFLPFQEEGGERRVWRFNLLFLLTFELLSRLDPLASRHIMRMMEGQGDILALWNYPFGIRMLHRARDRARRGGIGIAVYEHNIEGDFYRERVGAGHLFGFLCALFSRIEVANLSLADLVLCASPKDREALKPYMPEGSRLEVWVPAYEAAASKRPLSEVAASLRERLEGGYVVGFVGSDYGPNVVAVRHILSMAGELGPGVVFLVVGSVCNRFQERDVPENVLLAGFVEDLEAHLDLCDAFISPKTTSDTGVEIKMMDYTRGGKPVFTTTIGSRGFEDYPGLIVAEIEEMPRAIRAEVEGDLEPPR
jgi:glycosyltransferase involved in cell wall biosynthesis